jgi:hypothetical protein
MFVHHNNVTGAQVVAQTPLSITARIVLSCTKLTVWFQLCWKLMMVILVEEDGCFAWNLRTNGLFEVKLMYEDRMCDYSHFLSKYLWNVGIPLVFNIFV